MTDKFPDIEIYLLKVDPSQISEWLSHQFGELTEIKHTSKSVTWQTSGMDIQFTQDVAKKFSSLWFKTNNTPWNNDLECAREAHSALGVEVRCSVAGWQEEDDQPGWIKLIRGNEKPFDWDI